jgi:hypothetical protein
VAAASQKYLAGELFVVVPNFAISGDESGGGTRATDCRETHQTHNKNSSIYSLKCRCRLSGRSGKLVLQPSVTVTQAG